MISNYLTVLEESLEKKIELLTAIEKKSIEQSEAFQKDEMTLPRLDELMEEKAKLIEEIEKLDTGFDSLYQKIKKELLENKAQYAPEIKKIQQSIEKVTGLSSSIQSLEARNKQLVENKFREERKNLQHQKVSSKVSMNYYQNMNRVGQVPPQFMDEKK